VLIDNTNLEMIPPPVGEVGVVAAVQQTRVLVRFHDGTVAWMARNDERLADGLPVICDVSQWNTAAQVREYAAEAKITTAQAIRELVSTGLSGLGYEHD
jgi:predicted component of type VI protein secretion system